MKLRLYSLALITAAGLCGLTAHAEQARPAAAPAPSAAADPFPGLKFRNIGPATMGGRIDDLAVLESNPAVFYVGTATGGLWKTMNNGTTWEALFDDQEVVSIGDVAIAPDNENLVWVGTGENNNRQSGSWGNGIYKSTDGGHTWKHMGLTESRHIARVIVAPRLGRRNRQPSPAALAGMAALGISTKSKARASDKRQRYRWLAGRLLALEELGHVAAQYGPNAARVAADSVIDHVEAGLLYTTKEATFQIRVVAARLALAASQHTGGRA